MSLATSPVRFTRASDNYPATPSAMPTGTNFTAGANQADGTAVSLIAAIAHDVHFFRIRIQGVSTSGADSNALGDVLIDPAGGTSWSPLVNDICCGFGGASSTTYMRMYEFPLYIASGSSIGWRAKAQHTANITTGYILIEAYGEPTNPAMWWCGQGVETLGATAAKGTAITPGNSGAAGTWTSVGSTTTKQIKSMQLGVNGSDNNSLNVTYHAEMGYGSVKLPGSGISFANVSTIESANHMNPLPVGCSIPVGTQMQARATCSGTAEDIYVALYGVY